MARLKRKTNRLKRRNNSRRYSRRMTKNRKNMKGGVTIPSFPLKKTLKTVRDQLKSLIKGVTRDEPFNIDLVNLSRALLEDTNKFRNEISNIGLSESTSKSLISILPESLRPGAKEFLDNLSSTFLVEILTKINEFESIFSIVKLDELKIELIASVQNEITIFENKLKEIRERIRTKAAEVNTLIFDKINKLEASIKGGINDLLTDTVESVSSAGPNIASALLKPVSKLLTKFISEKGIGPLTRLIFKKISDGIISQKNKLEERYKDEKNNLFKILTEKLKEGTPERTCLDYFKKYFTAEDNSVKITFLNKGFPPESPSATGGNNVVKKIPEANITDLLSGVSFLLRSDDISEHFLKWTLFSFTIIAFGEFKIIPPITSEQQQIDTTVLTEGIVDETTVEALKGVTDPTTIAEIQETADQEKDKLERFAEEEFRKIEQLLKEIKDTVKENNELLRIIDPDVIGKLKLQKLQKLVASGEINLSTELGGGTKKKSKSLKRKSKKPRKTKKRTRRR